MNLFTEFFILLLLSIRKSYSSQAGAWLKGPVSGSWSPWSSWLSCSVSCGPDGTQRRIRTCSHPRPNFLGTPCDINKASESRPCQDVASCPMDGLWSDWEAWGSCSQSCSGGQQLRSRSCTNPEPQFGGAPCSGSGTEQQACSAQACPGEWTPWAISSQCPANNCNASLQSTETRTCGNTGPELVEVVCPGDSSRNLDCPTDPGCIGSWSEWTETTACPANNCEVSALASFSRTCSVPPTCPGNETKTEACTTDSCIGTWTEWAVANSCPANNCDASAESSYQRTCDPPIGSCPGDNSKTEACSTTSCVGTWTAWTETTSCPANNCDSLAESSHSRTCNPAGTCLESETKTEPCSIDSCAGSWSGWSETTSCPPNNCDATAQSSHTRTCSPISASCPGSNTKTELCSIDHCTGSWTAWTETTSCPVNNCDTALYSIKQRTCEPPSAYCPGVADMQDPCSITDCSGSWSAWSETIACPSNNCDINAQSRHERTCSQPGYCTGGQDYKYEDCGTSTCPNQPASFGYVRTQNDRNYDQALGDCQAQGQTLPMPKTMDDFVALTAAIDAAGISNSVWAGIRNDMAKECYNNACDNNGLTWLDGDNLRYQSEHSSLTYDIVSDKDCLYIDSIGTESQLKSETCNSKKWVVCQIGPLL